MEGDPRVTGHWRELLGFDATELAVEPGGVDLARDPDAVEKRAAVEDAEPGAALAERRALARSCPGRR
jgi:hypothetical protein